MIFGKSSNKKKYDPFGRRILKISKPCTGGTPTTDSTQWVYTYYVNDAQGNVMATYTYRNVNAHGNWSSRLTLSEQMIYGSSRLGLIARGKLIATNNFTEMEVTFEEADDTLRLLGRKRYEYTNHLGNVLLVSTDRKMGQDPGSDGTIDYYHAVVDAYYDYGPFGNVLDGRSYSGEAYRYGFNGKESDDETYGNKNEYDFGARMYDPRIGRWLSTDPLTSLQPGWSPYKAFLNCPLVYIDKEGETEIRITVSRVYKSGETTLSLITYQTVDNQGNITSTKYFFGIEATSYTGLIPPKEYPAYMTYSSYLTTEGNGSPDNNNIRERIMSFDGTIDDPLLPKYYDGSAAGLPSHNGVTLYGTKGTTRKGGGSTFHIGMNQGWVLGCIAVGSECNKDSQGYGPGFTYDNTKKSMKDFISTTLSVYEEDRKNNEATTIRVTFRNDFGSVFGNLLSSGTVSAGEFSVYGKDFIPEKVDPIRVDKIETIDNRTVRTLDD